MMMKLKLVFDQQIMLELWIKMKKCRKLKIWLKNLLKKLNSTHNEAHTDYIASLCENTNNNDTYI